jgi:hypothetical protein
MYLNSPTSLLPIWVVVPLNVVFPLAKSSPSAVFAVFVFQSNVPSMVSVAKVEVLP